MKVLTADEMRRAEEGCARLGITTDMLMDNAGQAVADEVGRILCGVNNRQIVLLVGPGNNGGDGLVAARHLHDWGAQITLFLLGKRAEDDANLKLIRERHIQSYKEPGRLGEVLSSADAVIDALFGTGRSRPLGGDFKKALDEVAKAREKRPKLRVISLDLPSGLDADSGACDPACLFTDYTITLGFPKPGLYNSPGAGRAGSITTVDIGIPAHLAQTAKTELLTEDWARKALPSRPIDANKGSFGRVLVVAGSTNYIGAAYLACSGAMRVGAGLVTLATAKSLQPILASKLTEATYLPLPESGPGVLSDEAASLIISEMKNYQSLLLGCGLGLSQPAMNLVNSILFQSREAPPSPVIDADAVNILAKTPEWWHTLTTDAILTPHPGEMSRLTGIPVPEIQADRIGTAKRTATEWQKTVILKGAYTVIAAPEGRCRINPIANPGLASAGTGDVLAGVVAGLVAQGLSLFDAASLGVWLHAQAGEAVKAEMGDAGMVAGDLLPALPRVIKGLKRA
ncbi:MAG: NAD(P)H-hydrate dehydratase [Dehalococcoidales bacterium]|nr:NAD(P)H-hydrate dehydratase [Dehalococcoidales bacterium]